MPRDYQQSIKGRTLETQTPDPVAYKPAAQVVDTFVQPGPNNALKLAGALAEFNPKLTAYVDSKLKEEEDKSKQQGALGYLQGESPDGQNESWKDGYMALKWQDFGRQRSVAIVEEFEKNKDDPNFDVMGLIRQHIHEDLAGIQEDPRAIDQYLSQIMPLTENLQVQYHKHQQGLVSEETDRLLSARVGDLFTQYGQLSPAEFRQILDNDAPTWQAMGKTKKDMSAAYLDQLIAYAEANNDTSVFAFAKEKGADQIALEDVPGYKQKLFDAHNRVVEAEKKAWKAATELERADKNTYFNNLLVNDVNNPELNWDNIREHIGPHSLWTGEQAANFYEQVMRARAKGKDEGEALAVISDINTDPITLKSRMSRTEYKAAYKTATAGIFSSIDPNDPNSIKIGVARLIDLHVRSGVPSDELKNILGTVNTAAVDTFTGQVSPDLMFAVQLHKAITDSGNPDLLRDYTTDDSSTILHQIINRLDQRPLTEETLADAIQRVKSSRSEPAQQLAELTVKAPGFAQQLKNDVESEFNGTLSTIGGWLGMGDGPGQNIEAVQMDVYNKVRELVLQNGMPLEAAKEEAVRQAKAKFTTDGHGNFFATPKGLTGVKDVLGKGMKLAIDEAKSKFGADNNYIALLRQDNKTYDIVNTTSGQPVSTMSAEQVMGLARPVSFGDPENIQQSAELVGKLKKVAAGSSAARIDALAKMPELVNNYDEVTRLLATDVFSFQERRAIRAAMERKRQADAAVVRKDVQEMQSMVRHGDIFKNGIRQVPNDNGVALSTTLSNTANPMTPGNVAELAKYYYKNNPKSALVMMAEGVALKAAPDADGNLAVGFGYNFGARSVKEAAADLRRAGVATESIPAVMQGKKEITMDQAIRLFDISSAQYEKIASRAYGDGYDKLPKNVKAVVFDMAYNAGSPSKFKEVIGLFKQGDYSGAAKKLQLKYWDKNKQKYVNNERRVQLWREMLSGSFDKVLDKHIKKKGK